MTFQVTSHDGDTTHVRIHDMPTEALLRELLADVRALGSKRVIIETSHEAGDAWIRAGFNEFRRVLEAPLSVLETHEGVDVDPSYGSIHVQTDDTKAVIRAAKQTLPRLPGDSAGTAVIGPTHGWTSIFDDLCDREPEMLRRLALEVADRLGAVVLLIGVEEGRVLRFVFFERARIMDEYLSVPEYHGPLPPGEVIALGANPRVVARLTGADPERVRAIVRTATSPDDLPPAREILAEFSSILKLPAALHGYETGSQLEGAVPIARR